MFDLLSCIIHEISSTTVHPKRNKHIGPMGNQFHFEKTQETFQNGWFVYVQFFHCYISKNQDWLEASVSVFFSPRSRRKRRTLRRSKISQSPRCLEMEIGDGWFRGRLFYVVFWRNFFTYTFSHYEMILTLTWYWHAGKLTYIQLSSLYNHGKWHVFKFTSREVIFYTRKWWRLGDPKLLYSKGVTCSKRLFGDMYVKFLDPCKHAYTKFL